MMSGHEHVAFWLLPDDRDDRTTLSSSVGTAVMSVAPRRFGCSTATWPRRGLAGGARMRAMVGASVPVSRALLYDERYLKIGKPHIIPPKGGEFVRSGRKRRTRDTIVLRPD